jgi:hypothetical protein
MEPFKFVISGEMKLIEAHELIESKYGEAWDYDLDAIFLITESGLPIGMCDTDELTPREGAGKSVINAVDYHAIQPNCILDSNTSYFDAIRVICAADAQPVFAILENNKIVGSIHFNDLFKLVGQICLFSLVAEIEQVALDICLIEPKENWNLLSPARQRKIIADYLERKNISELDGISKRDLVESTLFCDKGTILTKGNRLPESIKQQIKKVFGKAEKIRNACAHASSKNSLLSLLDVQEFPIFVSESQSLLDGLKSILDKHRRDIEKEYL